MKHSTSYYVRSTTFLSTHPILFVPSSLSSHWYSHIPNYWPPFASQSERKISASFTCCIMPFLRWATHVDCCLRCRDCCALSLTSLLQAEVAAHDAILFPTLSLIVQTLSLSLLELLSTNPTSRLDAQQRILSPWFLICLLDTGQYLILSAHYTFTDHSSFFSLNNKSSYTLQWKSSSKHTSMDPQLQQSSRRSTRE